MGRRKKNYFDNVGGAEETPAAEVSEQDYEVSEPTVDEAKVEEPQAEKPKAEEPKAKNLTEKQEQPLRVMNFERTHLK